MSWTTYEKLLQNIATIDKLMAPYPAEAQTHIKHYYYLGDGLLAFIEKLPWVPVVVQLIGMSEAATIIESPNILMYCRYRFFRYESDAALWKLSN